MARSQSPSNRLVTGFCLAAITVGATLASATWLVLAYVNVKLLTGAWDFWRDGWVFVPVVLAAFLVVLAWTMWSRGQSAWIWIIVGGAALLGLLARWQGLI